VREIEAAEAMASRFEVFEQLAAGYVAAHLVTASVLGEVRPTPRPSRLQSALTAWEIQAHRTLATDPDAADLVRIGRVQALIASAAAVLTEAAAQKSEIDPEVVERVTATLDAAQVAWTRLAKRWGELTSPDSRADPALTRAASGNIGNRMHSNRVGHAPDRWPRRSETDLERPASEHGWRGRHRPRCA